MESGFHKTLLPVHAGDCIKIQFNLKNLPANFWHLAVSPLKFYIPIRLTSKVERERSQQLFSTVQSSCSLRAVQGPLYQNSIQKCLQHILMYCTRDLKLEKSALIFVVVTLFQLPSGWLELIKASGSARHVSVKTLSFMELMHIYFAMPFISESRIWPLKWLRIFSTAHELFGEYMQSYSLVTKDMAFWPVWEGTTLWWCGAFREDILMLLTTAPVSSAPAKEMCSPRRREKQ